MMQKSASRLGQFRRANPRVRAPSSVFEMATDDTASLYSTNSTATSTNFIFDDMVVNSQAYRRALSQPRVNLSLTPLQELTEVSSDPDTVVAAMSSGVTDKYKVPTQFLQRLPPPLLDSFHFWIDNLVRGASAIEAQSHLQYVERAEKEREEFKRDFDILREKNTKLRKYDVEVFEERQMEAKEREMLAAEYSRVVDEKVEVEHENNFLHEQFQQDSTFVGENEAKRKLIIESHRKELKLKDDEIERLKASCTIAKERNQGLEKERTENLSQIKSFEKYARGLTQGLEMASTELETHKALLADLSDACKTKEAELQRYRGFDSKSSYNELLGKPMLKTCSYY